MTELDQAIEKLAAEAAFSGVVRIDRSGDVEFEKAYGYADERQEITNAVDTRFAIASGTKGLTALTVMSLVDEGRLGLDTTARTVLGGDLPLVRDDVTVQHLLSHRSGIGDYLDESAGHEITDYMLPVSVHQLAETEDYLAVLDGHETAFAPDERFSYCNGGFVVLALIAERVGGQPFRELVRRRVCEPAGMGDTAFLRSDELPGNTAIGYLREDGPRTNIFHLPVRGSGDGGIYSTAADIRAIWVSLFSGKIVSSSRVALMVRPRSDVPSEGRRYGLGFWLHGSSDVVMLEGYDAGVSFWTAHDPTSSATSTVISNTSEGAWRIAELLRGQLAS